jgi:hypothetical protein
MKALEPYAFYTEAYMAFPRYQLDNDWFFKWAGTKFNPTTPVTYIFASVCAYDKVALNGATSPEAKAKGGGLQTLLLGDTKLRSDFDLVQNFGLSSARGMQEPEKGKEQQCKEFLDDLMNKRREAGGMVVPRDKDGKVPRDWVPPDAKGREILPIEGPGAILSTRKWSPMLNDSFIMAGAHREIDFYLALTGEEVATYDNLRSVKDDKERWRQFFVKSPGTLWGDGFPRVLMRELLGLKTFGYEPSFLKEQLGFQLVDKKAGDGANLSGYLTALENVGFQKKEKDRLLSAVASFLFGDADALKSASAAA